MKAIADLQQYYLLMKLGVQDSEPSIRWAIDRLRHDEEGEDLDITMLAAATPSDDAMPLVEAIIARYADPAAADEQLAAGKFIASLHHSYRDGSASLPSVEVAMDKLYVGLAYPNWMAMLSRNAEYALDMPEFLDAFEKEFDYLARLWESSSSRAEFDAKYDGAISAAHDLHRLRN